MKKLMVLLLVAGISMAQTKIESKVVEATVFKDRAMVVRSSDVELSKGVNELIFSGLTTDLRDETVCVEAGGSGEIKILDVNVERKFTTEIRKESINKLQAQIDSLRRLNKIADDHIAVLRSKQEFIESLKAEYVKYSNQKILVNNNTSKSWGELLNFVETNLTSIYEGIRKEEGFKSAAIEEIRRIEQTISQDKNSRDKNYKEITIKIETEKAGKFEVKPSYIVSSASWYPIYDARVTTDSKLLELSYQAMIRQSTGEDWEEVKLTFSTADPQSVKSLPELQDWFLDIKPLPKVHKSVSRSGYGNIEYDQNWGLPAGTGDITGYVTDATTGEPLTGVNVLLNGTKYGSATDLNGKFFLSNIPEGNYSLRITFIGFGAQTIHCRVLEKHVANINVYMNVENFNSEEVVVTATQPRLKKDVVSAVSSVVEGVTVQTPVYSNVSAKDLSTTFELKTRNSIPSDNSPHKVTIAIERLPIEFSYTSVPKILPKVYLKGKAVNTKDFPLLEGEINVFVDNDFINRTYIDAIVPNDTLALALGIDDNLQVEKKLINKFTESKGIFGGTKQITYEYSIIIKNNRKSEERITIFDQIPAVMNEEIKFELLNPHKTAEELIRRELVWKLDIKPGEEKSIPVKYKIEFPEGLQVYGLE